MCAEKTDGKNSGSLENFLFYIKPVKSRFENYLGKCEVFSKKLMEQCVNDIRPFSSMDKNKFKHIESTAFYPPTWFPDCKDPYKIEIAIRICLLFFTFDDHTECDWGDGGRNLEKIKVLWSQFLECLDKLMGKEINSVEWKPYIWVYYTTVEEIFRHYNKDQKKRFVQLWTDYANSNIVEAEYFEQYNNYKSIEDVIQVRISSIGLFPSLQLVEYVSGISLTDEEWLNKNNQLMITEACKWLIMENDITSFRSEWNECGNYFTKMHNSIAILVLVEGLDIQLAVNKVIEIMENSEKKCFYLSRKIFA